MGTQLLLFLQLPKPSPLTSLHPLLNLNKSLNSSNNNIVRCNSTGSNKTGGQFRFDPQNFDDYDEDDEFEFSSSARQRTWWSESDDYDDVWDFDDDDEFWVFKVFRAFGWMVPAIVISLLLGTGPNAFIMALAVPLGQTALSLVFDKVSGRTSKRWRPTPRPKTKKKPFTRSANNVRTNKEQQQTKKNGQEKANYSSWLNMDGGLRDKGAKRSPKFGGWDQLDDQVETSQKKAPSRKGNGIPKQQKKTKYSRLGRVRETPLLLRLLIAVFPFLGSWTRFLF